MLLISVNVGNKHFNSIKVRLEPLHLCVLTSEYSYFNSIKVRLEHLEGASLASSG